MLSVAEELRANRRSVQRYIAIGNAPFAGPARTNRNSSRVRFASRDCHRPSRYVALAIVDFERVRVRRENVPAVNIYGDHLLGLSIATDEYRRAQSDRGYRDFRIKVHRNPPVDDYIRRHVGSKYQRARFIRLPSRLEHYRND